MGLIGKYGECVFDTFVDRLTASSIKIRAAWLRPADCPFSDKKDVTLGFIRALSSRGGVSLLEQQMHPRELMTGPPVRRLGGWGWMIGLSSAPKRNTPATVAADAANANEEPDRPYWLCVSFCVPGDVEFIACYKIPEETVTFPPLSTNPKSMVPIDNQIMSAAIVDNDAVEDGEVNTLLDFTSWMQKMAGPNGDFFGREVLDARLAIAEALEARHRKNIYHVFLDHVISGKTVSTVVEYADGTEMTVVPRDFTCVTKPPEHDDPKISQEAPQ